MWLVSNNKLEGVIDNNGKIVIYLEHDQIGVDTTFFPKENLKNTMLLYDNLIPAKRGTKWGLFNKTGKLVLQFEYDSFGYIASASKEGNGNNVLLAPKYQCIVVSKNEKYGLVNFKGQTVVVPRFDKLYANTVSGERIYYVEINAEQILLDEYIKPLIEGNGSGNGNENNNNTVNNSTNNTVQNNTVQNNSVQNSANNTQTNEIQNNTTSQNNTVNQNAVQNNNINTQTNTQTNTN